LVQPLFDGKPESFAEEGSSASFDPHDALLRD
jgi:hypothetical protein